MKVKPSIHLNSLASNLNQSKELVEQVVLHHFKKAGVVAENYLEHEVDECKRVLFNYYYVGMPFTEVITEVENNINNLIIEP